MVILVVAGNYNIYDKFIKKFHRKLKFKHLTSSKDYLGYSRDECVVLFIDGYVDSEWINFANILDLESRGFLMFFGTDHCEKFIEENEDRLVGRF